MRLRRAAVIVVSALSAIIGACTSLSGLSGAVDGPDGGPEAGDATPELEAATDAPLVVDGSFCQRLAPKPTFCDDFEREALLGPWDTAVINDGGSVAIELDEAGVGRALRSSIAPLDGGRVRASLTRTFDVSKEIVYRFRLSIDVPPTSGGANVATIIVNPQPKESFAIWLYVRANGVNLGESTSPADGGDQTRENLLAVNISPGGFHDVELRLTLEAPPRVSVTVDGKMAWDAPAYPFVRPGRPIVHAGVQYAASTGAHSVRIDDVTVDVH